LADWRKEGAAKLDAQAWRCDRYERYFDGEVISRLLTGEQRDIFALMLPASRTNWAELVTNAVAERLLVTGFRFGGSSDDAAWAIWQASAMDSRAEMCQTDALVCGHTFVGVWPDEENPTGVQIVPEHPTQTTLLHRWSGGRRKVVAAYKRIVEGDELVEQLIFPDAIATWERAWNGDASVPVGPADVDPDMVEDNPAGVVPIVELAPAPRTKGPPRSELQSVLPIQDRINLTIYQRMVATDFGAFRQIWATGMTLERTDGGGYKAPFNVGADRLLTLSNAQGRIGVIPESSLSGYLDAVAADVQHLAAITQTPPHYLLGNMVNISGEALQAAESGLVAKVRRRAAHLGQGWEDVQRIALGYVGDPGAVNVQAETVWANFETRSEAQLVDALVKMRTLGVPLEVLWARWGASPQQIGQWQEMAARENAAQAASTAAALGAADPYAQLLAGSG